MKTMTIEATTAARAKAFAAAQEAGDDAAQAENAAWTTEVKLPESVDEAIQMWGSEEVLKLASQKYVINAQQNLRSLNQPKSDAARKRALIERLLAAKGVSLEELEAELLAE